MTPTGIEDDFELRTLDELIARGKALIQARRNPEKGRKRFADFSEAYHGWYVTGKDLIAALAGVSAAKDWTAGWCRGMHSLTDPGAALWLKEQERQQAMLVELRARLGANRGGSAPETNSESRYRPEKELLADLRRVAKALGKNSVTTREYRLKGRYDECTIIRRFGSWNEALETAALEPGKPYNIPTEELFENLARAANSLGRRPVKTDMVKPLSKFSCHPYVKRFGGWLRALKKFDAWTKDGTRPEEKPATPKGPRHASERLRYIVFERDSFTCTACGRSPATEKGVKLHLDHKIPWSRGGRTTLDNLTTLCEKCNLGKGDL